MFRLFENKVLTKILGAKRDQITGEWKKVHNTELHALYSLPNIIIVCLASKENLPVFIFKQLVRDQAEGESK